MDPIHVALADDHQLFRKGIRFILDSFDHIELTLEVGNGQELLDALEDQEIDVVLLDLKMPVMDGVETTRQLRRAFPDLKILLLSMHDDERLIAHLMDLGAHGYLLKNEDVQTLREAIETVVEKDFFFNEYVSQALLKQMRNKQNGTIKQSRWMPELQLTRRELEILQFICQEFTTAEIAEQLFISTRTVEGHRRNLLEKTGVRNTAGLVLYAVKHGLVQTL